MKRYLLFLLAAVLMTSVSFAQVSLANIYGTVVLSDGSPVPGVSVTLTSDVGGAMTAVTSAEGNFRFIKLNPGNYELKFELDGFKTVIRRGIRLSLDQNATMTVMMETSPIKEEVVVTAKAGVVDTRKTTVGTTLNKEEIQSLPTARNPWTVMAMAAGMMVDRVDIGGAESGQQSTFNGIGGQTDDTVWNVDGANITDPSAIGAAPAYLNINAYEELQVVTGSADLTAQTGGVQLNFVTKRAGNKVSGDFHLYVEDKNWEMTQDRTQYMVDNGYVVPGVNRLYQYGVSVGGPIVKNKLWWYGSWGVQDVHKRTEPGSEDSTWLTSGYGKINFQLGKTTGDFHLSYDNKSKFGRAALGAALQNNGSLWDQTGPGYLYYGGLSHMFGNLMLEAKVVYSNSGFKLDPRGSDRGADGHEYGIDGAESRFILDEGRLLDGISNVITDRNSTDLSLSGNYFKEKLLGGDHEIRFGVDYFTAKATSQSLYPNQRVLYIYRDGSGTNYIKFQPDYYFDVNFKRISAYIGDTINFGKLTVGLGLRYDKESGGLNDIYEPGLYWVEPGSAHDGEQILPSYIPEFHIQKQDSPVSWKLLSPRLSLTYDLTGDGKNVLKLSAGQYGSQSGINLVLAPMSKRYAYFYWDDANHDETPQYDEVDWTSLHGTNFIDSIDPATGLVRLRFDKDYNTPILTELTLTYERALTEDLAVALTGMYKKRTNLAQDNNSRGVMAYTTKGYFANGNIETAANYQARTIMVNGQAVTVYDQIDTPTGTYYYNYKDSYYRWLALQVEVNKRMSHNWMLNASFSYQKSKKHLAVSDLVELNNYDYYEGAEVSESVSGSGLSDFWLSNRWMFKLSGIYQLPWDVNLSTTVQVRDGNPYARSRKYGGLNQGSRYIYETGKQLGDERLPTMWILNFGLEKNFKVSDTCNATLLIDWYNATNNQIVQKYNRTLGSGTTALAPVMWTNPGLFQFGVRVNF